MGIESLTNVMSFSLPSFNFLYVVEILAVAVIAVVGIRYLLPILTSNIVVEYFEIRGGKTTKIQRDYVKQTQKEGVEKWELIRSKTFIEPQASHYLYPVNKKKDKIYMVKDSSGFFHPIELATDGQGVLFKPIQKDVLFFFQQERKAQAEKLLSQGWKQHLPIMMFGGTMVMCLVIIIFTVKYAGNAADTAAGAVKSISPAIDNLANALGGLKGSATP